MLSKKMEKALNAQIKHELYSSHLYLSMAAACSEVNLPGFASWMQLQSSEERGHGMKLYHYIISQNGRVELEAIEKPPAISTEPLKLFTAVLEHERKVTALIRGLYELALAEKDYPTQFMLQWFITEQVEEEGTVLDLIEKIKLVGTSGPVLLMLDRELGARQPG